MADVFLKAVDAVTADDEPKFESAESLAQRDLPVLHAEKLTDLYVNIGYSVYVTL